jgi:hypothetical protein
MGTYHNDQGQVSKLENQPPYDSVVGLHREKRALVVSRDVIVFRDGRDFVVQPVRATDSIMSENGQREVDNQNERNSCMEIVRDKGGFQPANRSIQHHCRS